MTRRIALSQGLSTIVDDEDYPRLMKHKWCVRRDRDRVYAVRGVLKPEKGWRPLPMHREIICAEPGEEVDHINRDGLDNRRANLRIATTSQNQANMRVPSHNSSGFKGVSWIKSLCRWRVYIHVLGSTKYVGIFDDPRIAARAYDEAAVKHFGEFARTNADMGLL